MNNRVKYILIFSAILILAIFLRVYKLDTTPPGLWYDEAINGLDALDTIEAFPHIPIFYTTDNHPREPIIMWYLAILFKLFSPSILLMRIAIALVGILTVATFFLLAKEFFKTEWAFVAMLLFAAFEWNFHLNRLIFRANILNLFSVLALLFLIKFLDKRSRIFAILSGIFLGLGFYTYFSIYAFVMFYVILILLYFGKDILKEKEFRLNIFLLFLASLIIFSPLLIDYIKNPNHIFGRVGEVSLFGNGFVAGIKTIIQNFFAMFAMFIYKGDLNQKFNNSAQPVFDILTALIFYLGLFFLTINWRKRNYKQMAILLYFFFMILPSVFSVDAPHSLRALGSVPAIVLILTYGYATLYLVLSKFLSVKKVRVIIAILLIFFCSIEYNRYFNIWAKSNNTWNNFNSDYVVLTEDLRLFDNDGNPSVVYISNDIFYHPTFKFEMMLSKKVKTIPLSDLLQDNNILKKNEDINKYIFIFYIDRDKKEVKNLIDFMRQNNINIFKIKEYKTIDNKFTLGILYKINLAE